MKTVLHASCIALVVAVSLAACNNAPSQQKSYDLYELRTKGVPVDYDHYYSAPRGANLCSSNSINESPSCGGI